MPYKFRERKIKGEPRKSYLPHIIGIVLLVTLAVSTPYIIGRYQARSERLRIGRAQQALSQGDAKTALLEARAVLDRNPKQMLAKEIVEKASEIMSARDALSWRNTSAAMDSGDTDRLLALAEGFIAAQDYTTAERALQKVREDQRHSAKYEDLLGNVAAGRNDAVGARKHWEEAARIEPTNDTFRVKPIAMRLVTNDSAERADALRELEEIKKTATGAIPVQRALIADGRRRGDLAGVRDLAVELAALPGAEFWDKLTLLNSLWSLRAKRNDEFNASLAEMQKIAAANPQDVLTMGNWMIEHDLAYLVIEWAAELPPDFFSQFPAAPALAQAYVQMAEWKKLKTLVDSANWGEEDYMRLAFFAYSLDRQGNRNASETLWKDAFSAAQVSPDRLERLARLCNIWGWREPAEQVLWKLGASEWCPRWVMDTLWAKSLARNDTAKLQEVAKMRLRMDPKSVVMRNNQATFAMLLGEADDAIHREARAVHEEKPESAAVAATYAYSLFLQGRASEAVKVMEGYPSAELRVPVVALYYGAFLAAAGDTVRAPEFLRLADAASKLPEEASLQRVFAAVCEAHTLEMRADYEGALAAWTEALRKSERQPAWLDLLAKTAISWKWEAGADAALLKLAVEDRCPPGAEESLWAAAVKTGNGLQIYRASRLLARVKPNDPAVRSRYVLLAALGQRSKEPPVALAEQLARDFPASPEATTALVLALVQQGRIERAVQLISAMPPAQRKDPRTALYAGIAFAAAGQTADAEREIEAGAPSAIYEEEKALVSMIRTTFAAAKSEQRREPSDSDRHWAQALQIAGDRLDWVEILARIAIAGSNSRHADAALWKLAAGENCPPWAAAALWASASEKGTSTERYRASKLIAKSDPKNLDARCTWIVLGLLTNQELDAPHREAKAIYATNVTDPGSAVAYALSLYLQKQREEALKILSTLTPAQIAEPRVSFYYGVFLGVGGDTENAANYLRGAAGAKLFPEERALAEGAITVEPLKAIVHTLFTASR